MKFTDHLFYWFVVCLVGATMFLGGQAYKWYTLKPVIIDNKGGHYDMVSGDFVWGAPPRVLDDEKFSEDFSNAVKPTPTKEKKNVN
jgi:hypothetical protein